MCTIYGSYTFKFTIEICSTTHKYLTLNMYCTRKSLFLQSPPLPSSLCLQCIFTDTYIILKMRKCKIIQIYTSVFSVLETVVCKELRCSPSSSLSSSSHNLPHPIELHIFTYPLFAGRVQNSPCSNLLIKAVNLLMEL